MTDIASTPFRQMTSNKFLKFPVLARAVWKLAPYMTQADPYT